VAQSVKRPTLDFSSDLDLKVTSSSPTWVPCWVWSLLKKKKKFHAERRVAHVKLGGLPALRDQNRLSTTASIVLRTEY